MARETVSAEAGRERVWQRLGVGPLAFGLMLGVLAGLALGVLVRSLPSVDLERTAVAAEPFFLTNSVFFVLALFGVLGGLLAAMTTDRLLVPHRGSDHTVHPGWIADGLFGLAGGLVIFLVIPGEFTTFNQGGWQALKPVAVALVGGYAGRKLMASKADEVVSRVRETVRSSLEKQEEIARGQHEELARLFSSQSMRIEDYWEEIERVLNKVKPQEVSLIYADIDDLKDVLRLKPNPTLLRERLLSTLVESLGEAADAAGMKYDVHEVTPKDCDRSMLLRAGLEEAREIAEQARKAFTRKVRENPELGLDGRSLTISVGVAASGESDPDALKQLTSLAGERLSRAKASGKDRVVAASA